MSTQRTVFSQLLDYVPRRDFARCVERYRGNHNTRSFSCWDQFLCMAFAQLTYRESLRDIEICLRAEQTKLYRIGLRGVVSRSTLSDANEHRDSRIYQDFCQVLMKRARELYVDETFSKDLDEAVYVLDSTFIALCLSLCPWARYAHYKTAFIKVHTLLDLRGAIPSFIAISKAQMRDNFMLDEIPIEPGAFYVMDRAYLDFARLYKLNQSCAFFITRPLRHVIFRKREALLKGKQLSIVSDLVVRLGGRIAARKYPDCLRKIRYHDKESGKKLTFITNNFFLSATTIADLYKARWQVEIFFKWIKQNLRIKKFYGTSRNAIETQIWIAISTYLLIAIAKRELAVTTQLSRIVQLLSLSTFSEKPILYAFRETPLSTFNQIEDNQLILL